MKARTLVMVALVGALGGTAFAQEAPPPAATTAQAAAPAVTERSARESPAGATVPAATPNPANAPTSSGAANAAQTKTSVTTTATATPTGPSPAVLKKARQNGYQVKVSKGITYFCKKSATIGSRFVNEQCVDQDRFETTLEKQQIQREQIQQSINVCGTNLGACNGGG